jgi:hypothetical protein
MSCQLDQQDNIRKWLYSEEGPHESVGFMNGKINGVEVSARGRMYLEYQNIGTVR